MTGRKRAVNRVELVGAAPAHDPAAASGAAVGGVWPFVELVSDYTGRIIVIHRSLIGTIADRGAGRVQVTPLGRGGRGWMVRATAGEVVAAVRRAFGCDMIPDSRTPAETVGGAGGGTAGQ